MSSIPEPQKSRILAHMNSSHTSDLTLYLRAFAGLSAPEARDPQLTDLSLTALTIIATSTTASPSKTKTHTIPLSPPLTTPSEARPRLIAMSQRAQEILGESPGTTSKSLDYTLPRGWAIASAGGIVLYCASVAALPFLHPGTFAWRTLDAVVPAAGFVWLVRTILAPVFAIHVIEAFWMARSRLARHGVPIGSKNWLLWTTSTFMEGYPAMMRFDELAETERRRKESAKH
ncbi:uncharacterized protein GGS25DRAFT_202441 [Hypoxylon fragiforme]|uniref:uncharacterized protein n=1 Tax=Hypoxylon fragiforme TaxID=63214 RepID=UPI0020C70393|nr:uncharacterized protein GGS25DRAFT_202441 [Hypoxylon fragiforme]KAI2611607.1 hypothetical protein GGS25DRAFT_202441 [Hypoxylon fragiforme]